MTPKGRELYSESYESGRKVIDSFRVLISAAIDDLQVHNTHFKNLFYVSNNERDILNKLRSVYSGESSIASKQGNNIVYMANSDSITFRNPSDLTESVTLGIIDKDEKHLYLEQMNEYTYDYYEFYNTIGLPIYKHKHVSGSGISAVSNTTKYNPDGSEKSIFDFLNKFF